MSTPDPAVASWLRDDLASSGLTTDGLAARLGPVAAAALGRDQAVPAEVALAGDDGPLATLVRCFLLGRPVRRDALAAALPGTGVDAVAAAGAAGRPGRVPRPRAP